MYRHLVRREERAWVWFAFVLVENQVALMAYLLTRAPPRARGARGEERVSGSSQLAMARKAR
ncbi:hypothetical protein ACFL6X_07525 [Candidatus Latescibacterota bacterium]